MYSPDSIRALAARLVGYPLLVIMLCAGGQTVRAADTVISVPGSADVEAAVPSASTIKPAAMAKPASYSIRWATYRTEIVIEASAGMVRPAWIVTYATAPDQVETTQGKISIAKGDVVVAYRGQAFLDAAGVLHIDAHGAQMTGMMKEGWYPDSFDISSSLSVTTHDDSPDHGESTGEVERVLYPQQEGKAYRALLLMAQAIIEDDI